MYLIVTINYARILNLAILKTLGLVRTNFSVLLINSNNIHALTYYCLIIACTYFSDNVSHR